jgi:hypothetical protein
LALAKNGLAAGAGGVTVAPAMKTLSAVFRFGLVLQSFFLLGVSPCFGQTDPSDVTRRMFSEFQMQFPEMVSSARAAVSVVRYPSYYLCSDGDTTLMVDMFGHASYKRNHGWPGPLSVDLDSPSNSTNYSGIHPRLIWRLLIKPGNWQNAWLRQKTFPP